MAAAASWRDIKKNGANENRACTSAAGENGGAACSRRGGGGAYRSSGIENVAAKMAATQTGAKKNKGDRRDGLAAAKNGNRRMAAAACQQANGNAAASWHGARAEKIGALKHSGWRHGGGIRYHRGGNKRSEVNVKRRRHHRQRHFWRRRVNGGGVAARQAASTGERLASWRGLAQKAYGIKRSI
jgi:hypothetical protein